MGFSDFFRITSSGKTQTFNTTDTIDSASDNVTSSNSVVSINEDTAMKISALYQGVNIICDTIGSMPIYLYREVDGYQQVVTDDKRNLVLSLMSNEVLSALNLKRSLLKDLILRGNAYAIINRIGDSIELEYVPVDYVTPKKDNSGYYFEIQSFTTDVLGEKFEKRIITYSDMLVLIRNNKYNSIIGQGLLDYAASTLDMATEETTYMSNLFKNGLSAKAILNAKNGLKGALKDKLKRDLLEFYSGSKNAGKMLVLEGDFELKSLSLSPSDLKLIENKNFTITDIARYLNIPKHLLNIDRQQGTYSNITQERLQLLQNTLLPYVIVLENACNQKLLTEEEIAQGYYFKCNTSEMLKLTPEDQAKYMLDLYREDVVVVDEVRAALNLSGDASTIAELKNMQLLKNKIQLNEINNNLGRTTVDNISSSPEAKQADASSPKVNDKEEDLKIKETKGKEE